MAILLPVVALSSCWWSLQLGRETINRRYDLQILRGGMSMSYIDTPMHGFDTSTAFPYKWSFKVLGFGPHVTWLPEYESVNQPEIRTVYIFVPLWPVWLVVAFSAVVMWRRARRDGHGACPKCGYEAQGLIVCPECGGRVCPEATPPLEITHDR